MVVLCLGAPATAAAEAGTRRCLDDAVCIEAGDAAGDTNVELFARNLRDYPVVVSMYVRARHLRVYPGREVSRTLEPRQRIRLVRLESDRPGPVSGYRYWFDWSPGRLDARHDSTVIYRLPYAPGQSFRILQGFASSFSHTGDNRYAVDFDMPVNTPVHAAREGRVVATESGHDRGCWQPGCGKYANYIVILHPDGTTGEYYHLAHRGVVVDVGDDVGAGDHIGFSGNTGHTTMPHLHFAVYRPRPWGRFESLAFRFRSRDGVVDTPRRGRRYVAE